MANAHTLDSIADFTDAIGQLRFTRIKQSFAEGFLKTENVLNRISQENDMLRMLGERADILCAADPTLVKSSVFTNLAKKEGLLS